MVWLLLLAALLALAILMGWRYTNALRWPPTHNRRFTDQTIDEHLAGALGWTELRRVGRGEDEHVEGINPDTLRLERLPTASELMKRDLKRRRVAQ